MHPYPLRMIFDPQSRRKPVAYGESISVIHAGTTSCQGGIQHDRSVPLALIDSADDRLIHTDHLGIDQAI